MYHVWYFGNVSFHAIQADRINHIFFFGYTIPDIPAPVMSFQAIQFFFEITLADFDRIPMLPVVPINNNEDRYDYSQYAYYIFHGLPSSVISFTLNTNAN